MSITINANPIKGHRFSRFYAFGLFGNESKVILGVDGLIASWNVSGDLILNLVAL